MDYNFLKIGLTQYYKMNKAYKELIEYVDCHYDIEILDKTKNQIENYWNNLNKIIFGKVENSFNVVYSDYHYNDGFDVIVYKNKYVWIEDYIVYAKEDSCEEARIEIGINNAFYTFYEDKEETIDNKWDNIIKDIINNINEIDYENFKMTLKNFKEQYRNEIIKTYEKRVKEQEENFNKQLDEIADEYLNQM